jgi:hypothetical protein
VLGGPADFVGGLALVAIGDEEDFLELGHGVRGMMKYPAAVWP